MPTQVVRPRHLTPAKLDEYLERGWYRIGQTLMTCRYLISDDGLHSTIWTRLPLADHAFRSSQRRQIRKTERDFRIEEGPRVIDRPHEALYQRYLRVAPGERPPTLRDFLFGGGEDRDLFDTWEIRIFDGDRLVAFSWFDRGERAVQSLIGVYDPDYRRHSLGYFTMLAEVRWAVQAGMDYHYAGYVLPGTDTMEYKLRVGDVEYLHPDDGRWRDWSEFSDDLLPTRRLRSALRTVRDQLGQQGIDARVRLYPMFEAPAYNAQLRACIAQPLVLECTPPSPSAARLVVTFDEERELFGLQRCLRVDGTWRPSPAEDMRPVELLVIRERLGRRTDAAKIARDALRHLPLRLRRG